MFLCLFTHAEEIKHLTDTLSGFDKNRAHLDNGAISEHISTTIYKKNGFSKLDAEVGRNGIDGLYVKRDKTGKIKNVVFSEVKYGTAKLGTIQNGSIQQMSKEWKLSALNKKISQLEKLPTLSPQDKKLLGELKSIKKMVKIDSPLVKSQLTKVHNLGNGKFSITMNEVVDKGTKKVEIGKQLKHRFQTKNARKFEIDINKHYKPGTDEWKLQKVLKHSVRKEKRLLKEGTKLQKLMEKQKKLQPGTSQYRKNLGMIKKQKKLIKRIERSKPNISNKKKIASKVNKSIKNIPGIEVPSIIKRKGKKILVFMDASLLKKATKGKKLKYLKNVKGGDVVMMVIENGAAIYSLVNGTGGYKQIAQKLLKDSGQELAEHIFTKGVIMFAAPPASTILVIAGSIAVSYGVDKYEELDKRKYVGIEDMLWDVPDEIKNKLTIFDLEKTKRKSIFEEDVQGKSIFDEDVDGESIFDDNTENKKSIFDIGE
jgi:nitrate reductase NapAB chaperone NapD